MPGNPGLAAVGRPRPTWPQQQAGLPPRFGALDGLRGLAALTVVLFHTCLTIPTLAGSFEIPEHRPSGLGWVLTFTPVRLAWAGGEAVYAFFILSGFVLVLPLVRGPGAFRWRSYYPRRLARLYLPIWASLAVSVLLVLFVPRRVVHGASWWVNKHHGTTTVHSVTTDLFGIFGFSQTNSALWSLQYEILFSLALPLYGFAVFRLLPQRLLVVKVLLTVAFACAGQWTQHQSVTIAAVFLLGALMAGHLDIVRAHLARLHGMSGSAVAAAATLGIITPSLAAAGSQPGRGGAMVAFGVQLLCTTIVVALFLGWRPYVRVGESPVAQWLGRRSFSLYLIHEPIVVSVALVLGPRRVAWTPVAAVPLALAAAAAFYVLVEAPTHRLSRRIGRRREQRGSG